MRKDLLVIVGVLFLGGAVFFGMDYIPGSTYEIDAPEQVSSVATKKINFPVNYVRPRPVVHLDTPSPLKGIYMTSWIAGRKDLRQNLVDLIEQTELNAVIIDIKDYTGKVAFHVEDEFIKQYDPVENRIPDIRNFISDLHDKGIYVIGRLSAFQDPHMVAIKPEWAVKAESTGEVWKDYKGISWIDAGSRDFWDYLIAIAENSYDKGFDEINFDYIRFPSDGNMHDILFPFSEGKVKRDVMREFFKYVDEKTKDSKMVTSADLFGMTATNYDDLNIGQVTEDAIDYFDYISQMIYPSHYPPNFMGLAEPWMHPYEVIKYSMDSAVSRAGEKSHKLRPWLQDFSIKTDYTADMVRAQIQAVEDAGLEDWMLWSAANRYTRGALHSASQL